MREAWVWSLGWEDPLEKGKATHSSILVGEFHGLYSPWGRKESNTTEQLSLHFHKALHDLVRPLNLYHLLGGNLPPCFLSNTWTCFCFRAFVLLIPLPRMLFFQVNPHLLITSFKSLLKCCLQGYTSLTTQFKVVVPTAYTYHHPTYYMHLLTILFCFQPLPTKIQAP